MNDYQKKVLSIALSVSLLFNASCNKDKVIYNLPPEKAKIEEAKELEALLIDGGLVELPGRTHYAYLEALPQVIQILHNFL